MKLQYLGDYRDAFKWDLLHWTCSRSTPRFDGLHFAPLLTPDDPDPRDGQIPHQRFVARPLIHAFVESLRQTPRNLLTIERLGHLETEPRFSVTIHAPARYVGAQAERANYWRGFVPAEISNSIVFLDPDNGFETKTNHGAKWVRHTEIAWIVNALPASSAVVVYQHRPRRKWADVFGSLAGALTYAPFACAAYDSSLAFVALTRSPDTFARIAGSFESYAAQHDTVRYVDITASLPRSI